ncbi:MAG: hypothetical protein JWN44_2382, partial [Myxococcales bacterium]|nr:hypothetical protein [Myxococcales bacterium]
MKNLAWIVAGAILGPALFALYAWSAHALEEPRVIDAQPTRTTELWDHVHFTPGPELVADAVGATPIVVADGSLYLL